MLAFPVHSFAGCYNSSTINDDCRYPAGDTWCQENGDLPYAYLNSCEPLLNSSYEEEDLQAEEEEYGEEYEYTAVDQVKDYCADHPFICAMGAVVAGTVAYKQVQQHRTRDYSSVKTEVTKSCDPFMTKTSDDKKSLYGGCGNGKTWECHQKGDSNYMRCTGPKTIDNIPVSEDGLENALISLCCT